MKDISHVSVPAGRREFFRKLLAGAIGAVLGLVPLAAGLGVLFDPLRRKSSANAAQFVTTLDALPADGQPQRFSILATRVDAWNTFPRSPIGAVYLRRTGDRQVQAFNVVCPHAGCWLDYSPQRKCYVCPCHHSAFNLSGGIEGANSPAPRGMDALEAEVRDGNQVWVKFENFEPGRPDRVQA